MPRGHGRDADRKTGGPRYPLPSLRPVVAVERPVLDSFGDVVGADADGGGEVECDLLAVSGFFSIFLPGPGAALAAPRSLSRDWTDCWSTCRRSAGVSESIQRMRERSTPSALWVCSLPGRAFDSGWLILCVTWLVVQRPSRCSPTTDPLTRPAPAEENAGCGPTLSPKGERDGMWTRTTDRSHLT
jgi:hypothetical protein